jgi:hypothetical protein
MSNDKVQMKKECENPKFEIKAEVEAKVEKILSLNLGLNFEILSFL